MFERIIAKITVWVYKYEKFIRRVNRENKVNYGRLFKRLKSKGGR